MTKKKSKICRENPGETPKEGPGEGEVEPRPGLWVVATPIGNLGDLSPRAREALSRADRILCEDTRRTGALLSALGIPGSGRLERLDAHAPAARIERFVRELREGARLALASDAGTPGVSDPGARLVARAREEGVEVTPVPGPSAPVALLSVAGFGETEFAFLGFFPRKSGDREYLLKRVGQPGPCRVFLWFESPHRIEEALRAVAQAYPEARIVAAKELTKLHERFFHGEASQVAGEVREELAREGPLGEWCFAIRLPEWEPRAAESSEWVKALECLLDAQVPASMAARQVSQHFGAARKVVYETALRLSGKKSEQGD